MSRGPEGAAAPHLPSVDRVLGWARVSALVTLHGRSAVLEAVRAELVARRALKARPRRKHLADYADAISPKTALLLKVHASNYEIRGFTAAADARALAALAKARGVPFVVDLGSGALGGRADLVAAIRRNPMKRAMRCDKLTLAALGAVLALYADPERLPEHLPAQRWLTRPAAEIAAAAERLAPVMAGWLGSSAGVEVVAVQSQIGSGSLPVDLLPSFALRMVTVTVKRGSGRALDALAAALRGLPIPVIGRIANGALLLDLRCLASAEDETTFRELFSRSAPQ